MKKKEKLKAILEALDEQELRAFNKFLKKRQINKLSKKVFDGILKLPVESKSAELIQYTRMSMDQINYHCTLLLEWSHEFLLDIFFQKSDEVKLTLLAQVLDSKQSTDYALELYTDIEKTIEKKKISGSNDSLFKHIIYKRRYFSPTFNNRNDESLKLLEQASDSLDVFYYTNKLELICERINRDIVFEGKLIIPPLSIPADIEDEDSSLQNYLYLYRLAKMIDKQSEASKNHLQKVLEFLKENTLSLELKEYSTNFLVSLVNYEIFHEAKLFSHKDLYEIYRLAMSAGWLVQKDGYIYFEDFMNVISSASNFGDLDLLKSIHEEYQKFAKEEYRLFVVALAKAYLAALTKEWEKGIQALQLEDHPNLAKRVFFLIQRNILEIKLVVDGLLADGEEYADLEIILMKHENYIKRKFQKKELPKKQEIRNLNFISLVRGLNNILKKLLVIRKQNLQDEAREWKEAIENCEGGVVYRSWLLEKAAHLLNT